MVKDIHDCLFCNGKISKFKEGIYDTRFGVDGHFDIYKCSDCGLVQLGSYPSESELKSLYETYYNFGGSKKSLYTKLRRTFLESVFYRLWMAIDGDICFHSRRGNGRLLDMGCNEGRGLSIYQKNGFEAEGLELNEQAAAEARKHGFNVYTDPVETFQPKDSYDVVVLSNVLEHSLDPKDMLFNVARILKPGGQVWISCPNNQSWLRYLFGRYWINWHVPFHITHFSMTTLTNMLRVAGFEIQEEKQASPALWFAHSIIARLFARSGKPTRQLRNSALVAGLMILVRTLLFPILWLGNQLDRGDCLVLAAQKRK